MDATYTFAMNDAKVGVNFVWMRRVVIVLVFAAVRLWAQSYSLGPDSQPRDGVPKGTVTKHVLAAGVFYPGTPHNYAVYVPAQYDAKKPTAFMVFLDGSGYLGDGIRIPVVFDNLIAKHELPPMIGIFVDPGVLPAISDEKQSRYERIFEYDSLSARYSKFLLEELIPAVAKEYNLSTNPDDHGIAGTSTGAVGAFMAAWNRPDQFHRVLSFIGTYVAMKGADELPALVRKTEPKPIRIFMQDGTGDHIVPAEPYGTSFAGSWPINNRVMFEALEYSGYDARLEMGTEAHNMKQGGAIMPDALRWLWRGYPEPIVVREPPQMKEAGWDPRAKVYATVWADRPWEQVGGSYGEVASPTGDDLGDVFFADATADRIYKADSEGKVTVFREKAGGVKALREGPSGVLYAYLAVQRQIVAYGPGGDQRVVARDLIEERRRAEDRRRIAEVRVIEQPERLEPELKPQPLLDREILEQGEIDRLRARPVKKIPARVPVCVVGREGWIQVCQRERGRVDAANQVTASAVIRRRMDQIRPVSAARPGVGGVDRGRHVERDTGLQRDDPIGLPLGEHAFDHRIRSLEERNVVNKAGHKPVPDIPVGIAVIVLPVVRNQWRSAAVRVGGYVQRMRPRIACQHLQPMRQPLMEDDAHAFIVGDFICVDGPDHAEQRIRPPRVHRARTGLQRSVVIEAAVQVIGMRAEILHFQSATAPELSFEPRAPLIHARRRLVPRVRNNGPGRGRRRAHTRREWIR